jgi:hypothetical protein
VSLPVPRDPITCQLSMISALDLGNSTVRTNGRPFGLGAVPRPARRSARARRANWRAGCRWQSPSARPAADAQTGAVASGNETGFPRFCTRSDFVVIRASRWPQFVDPSDEFR